VVIVERRGVAEHKRPLSAILSRAGIAIARPLKVTLDGEDLSGEYFLLAVMNIEHIGPSLHIAPDADPSDGLLEVVLLSEQERAKFGDYLYDRLQGHERPLRWMAF
jgi:diacylglycerol kinase family enzyme